MRAVYWAPFYGASGIGTNTEIHRKYRNTGHNTSTVLPNELAGPGEDVCSHVCNGLNTSVGPTVWGQGVGPTHPTPYTLHPTHPTPPPTHPLALQHLSK